MARGRPDDPQRCVVIRRSFRLVSGSVHSSVRSMKAESVGSAATPPPINQAVQTYDRRVVAPTPPARGTFTKRLASVFCAILAGCTTIKHSAVDSLGDALAA